MRCAYRVLWHALSIAVLVACCGVNIGRSQINFSGPQPGDVYREYTRSMPPGSGDAWRVTDPNVSLSLYPQAAPFLPNPSIDLNVGDLSGAVRAEAVISMWGGHVGTTGKKIRFNGNSWITIPELGSQNGIPTGHNGECYITEPTVVVNVPLSHLRTGTNYFTGTNTGQTCYTFQWGQHGWYNLMLRIYYDPSQKSHPSGAISSPAGGNTMGENPTIAVSVNSGSVDRIDVLASYFGYDTDGDGVYTGYHYDYQPLNSTDGTMMIHNHVGTMSGSTRQLTWNTQWVPDQAPGGIKLIARLRDASGVWYCTSEVTGLSLSRSGSVKLYVSPTLPERAWARGDLPVVTSTVTIPSSDNVATATAAAYHIRTWNGIDIAREPGETDYRRFNDWTDGAYGGNHCYSYDLRTIPLSQLRQGSNTFAFYSQTTAHHGIEILWPGPALVVRYSSGSGTSGPTITQHPVNKSVSEGQTATFSVGATGTLPLSYQWQKNNSNISGANSSSYTTPAATLADNNSTFRCVVTNNYGTATSNAATLTVTTGGGGGGGADVLSNGSFESGTSSWVFYTNGAGQFTTAGPGTDGSVAGRIAISTAGTNVQLYQSGIALEPSTQYTLKFDAYASVGRTIAVTLQQHGSPYTNYGLRSQPFTLGTSWQTFTVTFTTSGFSNSVNDGRLMFWLSDVDAAGDQYFIDNVMLTSGSGGSTSGPTITSHPVSKSVSEGQTATFTVGASGTAPLSYQWQKNNADIGGATSSSYTTPPVTLSDNNATFRCVVKNNYGTATSNAATLTVTTGGGVGGTNVLANGSFESGTGGWFFYTNGSGSFAAVAPGTDGSAAGRVTIAAAGTNVQLYQSGFSLEAGVQYTLSFDAYATAARTIGVSVQKHVSPYTNYGLNGKPISLGTSWQTFSVTFTAGGFSGTATDARLMIWLADVDAAGDQYFFDNVVLSKPGSGGGGGTTTNALANGSFESGMTGWTFYTNGTGGAGTVAPGTNGASAARVNITAPGTNVQLYQYGFTLEPSTAYLVTFDAHANAARTISVSVQKHGSPYTNYGLNSRLVALGTSWQSYSISFTTSGFSGIVTDPRLMIWFADADVAGDQYYFDNFVLGKPAAASPTVATTAITHDAVPTTNSISDIYPNPFNPSTNIRYTLTEQAVVTMRVYSMLGQEVATLVDGAQSAGVHTVVWDGRNSNGKPMGSGVYICRMMGAGAKGEPITSVKRMLLVK